MATSKVYLVPIDFSKSSEIALKHAVNLARSSKGRLLLVHVIPTPMITPTMGDTAGFIADYYRELEKKAQLDVGKLVRRHKLKKNQVRLILFRGGDPAKKITDQAKKSRVSMIVMGSHGRTGLMRLMLGSVAERTLRYAYCPVLIVKR